MKILLAGATGVLGRALLPELVSQGHHVLAASRQPNDSGGLALDLLDAHAVREALLAHRPDAVIHVASALPPALDPKRLREQLRVTNRLREEGTSNLERAAGEAGVKRIIAASIAFGYAPGEGAASENEPLFDGAPAGFDLAVRAVRELEKTLADANHVVLRLGMLYGPGTAYAADSTTAALVRKRAFPVIAPGEGRFSFLHPADAATAFAAALHGPAGVHNVCEDNCPTAREWLARYAAALGARPPLQVPRWIGRLAAGAFAVHLLTTQRGASNLAAREALGWQPRHDFMSAPLGGD